MAEFTIAGICYNRYETELAGKLSDAIDAWGKELDVEQIWYLADDDNPDPAKFKEVEGTVRGWTIDRFEDTDILIYIAPVVRVVRYLANLLEDQMTDPAVLAVDATGKYCVPLLSGRRGEAFELARFFEGYLGSEFINPVMPDDPSRLDIGIYAKKHDMVLSNSDYVKEIGAALGAGGEVAFNTEYPVLGDIPAGLTWASSGQLGVYISPSYQNAFFNHTLWLIPRSLSVGVIYEPGVSVRQLDKYVSDVLRSYSLYPEAVAQIATVQGLENDPVLQALAVSYGIPIVSWPEEVLQEICNIDAGEHDLCESAALKASRGKLLVTAKCQNGIRCAIAEKNIYITF